MGGWRSTTGSRGSMGGLFSAQRCRRARTGGIANHGGGAESDGEWDKYVARAARRVGAGSDLWQAAEAPAAECREHRARYARRDDDARAAGEASANRVVRELPCED